MKAVRIARRLASTGALVTLVAAGTLTGVAAPAYAESPPGCSSTTQIGSTAVLTVNGATFASVKQFKGCGKNWAYTFVWSSYRSTHGHWEACTSVAKKTGPKTADLVDLNCNYTNPVEVWSFGANTLRACTQAVGWYPDKAATNTDTRC